MVKGTATIERYFTPQGEGEETGQDNEGERVSKHRSSTTTSNLSANVNYAAIASIVIRENNADDLVFFS